MAKKLRVAVVGTGEWWGREHSRVFSIRADSELVAVVGRTPERTEKRAAEFRTTPYTDLATMLEAERPDLVSLCLPNEEHFDTTLEVIRAGFPLLVEKPLVFEPWQAAYLLAEAEKSNLFFALNFNHRYAVPVQMASRAIRAGELGDIVFATWRFGGDASASEHPFANLIETQCHGFDMLEHLCGPISSVAAEVNDLTGHGFSTVAIALRFASGAIGTMLGTYDSSYAYPRAHSLEVNGTEGRLLVDDTAQRYTQSRVGDATAQVWQAGLFDDRGRDFGAMFEAHLDELIPALLKGEQPPIHARAGARALDIATAVIESVRERKHVAVPVPD